jgi:hypothetical protein
MCVDDGIVKATYFDGNVMLLVYPPEDFEIIPSVPTGEEVRP